MAGRILDFSVVPSVVECVLNCQDDTGFTDEEFIPGLVCAVLEIAGRHDAVEQILDEASNLLADGGVDE